MRNQSYPFLSFHRSNAFIKSVFLLSVFNVILDTWTPFSIGDELITGILIFYTFTLNKLLEKKEFIVVISILFFYLIYSLWIRKNVIYATFFDMFVFLKPFVSFFVAFTTGLRLSMYECKLIRNVAMAVGVLGWLMIPSMGDVFGNLSKFYTFCLMGGLLFLTCANEQNIKDKLIALMIFLPGLFSIKSKYIVIFVFFIYIYFMLNEKISFRLKYIIIGIGIIAISLFFVWAKFKGYFIDYEEEEHARTAIYLVMPRVLIDYFPLGSGFGTYGTEAAARYYSPLYTDYGLCYVYGLRPEDYRSGHGYFCDTFYPILAEFGFAGIILYCWFWLRRYGESKSIKIFSRYKLFLFIFSIMTIQNIAEATFTSSKSLPLMFILGFCLHTYKKHTESWKK